LVSIGEALRALLRPRVVKQYRNIDKARAEGVGMFHCLFDIFEFTNESIRVYDLRTEVHKI
jgi:hypothetical protein